MLTTAILALALAQGPKLVCPISGEDSMGSPVAFEYAGSRFQLCCPMCIGDFKGDPAGAVKASAAKGKVVGEFLFDPVNGAKVKFETAKGVSDYGGIRYRFGTADDKKLFDADPKKYTQTPLKEALFCPVEQHPLKGYAAAGGFVDYKGVRFYTCCDDCLTELNTNPAKYVGNSAKYVKDVKAVQARESDK